MCSGIWCHAGTSQPRVQNSPRELRGRKKKHIRAGDNGDSIPGVAGGTGTGKPQRPRKGVRTEAEKVGLKEQEQWQIPHTAHPSANQGVCTNLPHIFGNLFSQRRRLPSPLAPHPTPPQLGSVPWASCCCDCSPTSKPPLSGAEHERQVPARRAAPPRRARKLRPEGPSLPLKLLLVLRYLIRQKPSLPSVWLKRNVYIPQARC